MTPRRYTGSTAVRAVAGTLQLPLQSAEYVRKRFSGSPEGLYHLVACVEGVVVGHLGLETTPRPRWRHVGEIGMAVRYRARPWPR